jgi:predicted Zn-dependent peptidase
MSFRLALLCGVIVGVVRERGDSGRTSRGKADTRLPIDDAVKSGRLLNGVRYFIRRHETPVRRAELRLVVHAGAVLEDEDQRGLAHFQNTS